ncbi:putative AMP-dependent synthetase/ligase, AMP-dependent synthetase-like superfamily [Helianthus annuus]|nr:putative AMP-dependent synthetase/ligase, ANL domain-containing protein [Helianthus annuus]KAJ0712785.1 putative AMP-dependent synthetase/ligase, ANL domain-containing protein [Helianthus annuus]KAJ0889970.1 putative AMP-dependent synthetase/ligase, AMP-dependent synthetase-like superfamily [Helianthus annuus]KAJ0894745.1 putative AMP-dependent synthetase/ligase [Helianthus annuus]
MSFENYDPCFPDQPVVDQYLPVWANLPSFRSKPAFIWAEDSLSGSLKLSSLTYEGLNNSVHFISSQLSQSFQRGDTIVILCSPGLELVEILFGCQRAGLMGVPIIPPNPTFSNDDHHHLIRVLSQTRPKAAVADRNYVEMVQKYIKLSSPETPLCNILRNLTWIPMENLIEMNVTSNTNLHSSYQGCKPDEVYLIQYTSGATGIPKPVLVTAGAAAHNVRLARKSYDLHPNSIITSWLPQYHDCGLMFLLLTIVSGATCVLTSPNAFINRPRIWLELITKFKATCTPVPSFTLPLVIKRGQVFDKRHMSINLTTMKNLIIINEPIYHESVKQFVQVLGPLGLNPSSISPSYGLAENCTFVSTAWRSKPQDSNFPIHNKLLPSARLHYDDIHDEEDQMNIVIVNEDTNELVEDGFEGEIWIASSPSNASGYLSHPSLTQEIFHSRLRARFSHERFIRTGDRGIIKGVERFLFVTGRCSDVIKHENGVETHAHYLETAAYESCTRFLRGGCIAAFQIDGSMTAIVAEMQKSGEKEDNMLRSICEGIREFVLKEQDIQVAMVALVKSGSIPKTTSGKIQRWLAKDRFLRGNMEVVKQMKFDKEDDNTFKKSIANNMKINKMENRKTTLYSNL